MNSLDRRVPFISLFYCFNFFEDKYIVFAASITFPVTKPWLMIFFYRENTYQSLRVLYFFMMTDPCFCLFETNEGWNIGFIYLIA